MKYNIKEKYNCVVIELKGNIMGGPETNTFREELHKLIEEDKKNVIADLSGVNHMNSSGIGMLISGLTTMRNADGDLKICKAHEKIKSLMVVTELITVFDHYRTLDEAIEAYQDQEEAS